MYESNRCLKFLSPPCVTSHRTLDPVVHLSCILYFTNILFHCYTYVLSFLHLAHCIIMVSLLLSTKIYVTGSSDIRYSSSLANNPHRHLLRVFTATGFCVRWYFSHGESTDFRHTHFPSLSFNSNHQHSQDSTTTTGQSEAAGRTTNIADGDMPRQPSAQCSDRKLARPLIVIPKPDCARWWGSGFG